MSKPGRREPVMWERGDKCLVEFDVKKEVGVQRLHLGEIVGKRGNRVHIVQLTNGDLHEVHEQEMHLLGASELILKSGEFDEVSKADIGEVDKPDGKAAGEPQDLDDEQSPRLGKPVLETDGNEQKQSSGGSSSSSSSSSSGASKSSNSLP